MMHKLLNPAGWPRPKGYSIVVSARGRLIFTAAQQKDFPLLEASVLVVGIVFLTATLLADIAYSLLNPRIRYAAVE